MSIWNRHPVYYRFRYECTQEVMPGLLSARTYDSLLKQTRKDLRGWEYSHTFRYYVQIENSKDGTKFVRLSLPTGFLFTLHTYLGKISRRKIGAIYPAIYPYIVEGEVATTQKLQELPKSLWDEMAVFLCTLVLHAFDIDQN